MLLGPLETSGSASLPPAPYGPTGFEASGKRKGFCFGGVLFFSSFPFPVSVCGLLLLRFPFRAVCFFGGFLALPFRPCVCVFTSVPKSNVFKKQGATLPFTREWPNEEPGVGYCKRTCAGTHLGTFAAAGGPTKKPSKSCFNSTLRLLPGT